MMTTNFYRYCIRANLRDQIGLIALSILAFPLTYLSLDVPKDIVNFLTAPTGPGLPELLGFASVLRDAGFGDIAFLATLSALLLLVLGGQCLLGYIVNNRETIVGQRLLRRLRYELLWRLMRLPPQQRESLSEAEVVSSVLSETRDFAQFGGQVLTVPVRELGTFIVILAFVVTQNWAMGLALLTIYPIQAVIVYQMQKQITAARLAAIGEERRFSKQAGEAVFRMTEIHANDASRYELSQLSRHLQNVARTRVRARQRHELTRAVTTLLNIVIPVGFYLFGGALVVTNELSLGALVAVVAAHRNLTGPWTNILDYMQWGESLKSQFAHLVARFDSEDILDERALLETGATRSIDGRLVGHNVSWMERDSEPLLDGVTFAIDLTRPTAIVGQSKPGLKRLSQLLARLTTPTSGIIELNQESFAQLPETLTGRRIGYISEDSAVITGSVRDNLLYGLYNWPAEKSAHGDEAFKDADYRLEAERTGNRFFQWDADWIDYTAAGVSNPADLELRMVEILRQVDLLDDLVTFALGQRIDPEQHPGLVAKVLLARADLSERLSSSKLEGAVDLFRHDQFNHNCSLAENIVFGSSFDAVAGLEAITSHPYMLNVLREVGIYEIFLDLGVRIARETVDTFGSVMEGDDFHLNFSLIPFTELPHYQALVSKALEVSSSELLDVEKAQLLDLTFRLVPAVHRFAVIDPELEQQILVAREHFARNMPADLHERINLFEVSTFNRGISIESNILFGRPAYNHPEAVRKLHALIERSAKAMDMIDELALIGLDYQVGRRGYRLTGAQTEKLMLARVLIKCPDLIVINGPHAGLQDPLQGRLFTYLLREHTHTGLIWLSSEVPDADRFDTVLQLEDGKLIGGPTTSHLRKSTDQNGTDAQVVFGLDADIATLRKVAWFENWSTPRLKLLLLTSALEFYPRGHYLVRQGETAEDAYVLIEGEVDIMLHRGGSERLLQTAQAPELLGEIALLCDTPRSASGIATTDITVLRIPRESFQLILAQDPKVASGVMQMLARKLNDMVDKFQEQA